MSKARDLADLIAAGNPLADGTVEVADISDLTATAAELNTLDGITSTVTELNVLDGITASTSELNVLDGITASTAELNNVAGVNSSVQTQLDTKQDEFTPNEVTTSTTATANNRYFLNGATITLTLPASPTAGDTVAISEMGGNADNIIGRNGSNIQSLAEDMTIDTAYASFQLQYVDATIGWAIAH